jgi:AP2 domain
MKEIPLTQGKVAMVDDEDFERVSQFKWFASKVRRTWYAMRSARVGFKKYKTILMHQWILDCKGLDHRDCDGLNNQKNNLRNATGSQNNLNQRKRFGTTSKFKGVYFRKDIQRWRCELCYKGERFHLGYFDSEEAASVAYINKAKELGVDDFARPL